MASKKCRDWLRNRGPTLTAHEVGVSVSAVWSWIYGDASPTAKNAARLIEISNGQIDLNDICGENNDIK